MEQNHEQVHGTDLWNRIMNRFMEQTYGTESWNRIMEQAQSLAGHTSKKREVGS